MMPMHDSGFLHMTSHKEAQYDTYCREFEQMLNYL